MTDVIPIPSWLDLIDIAIVASLGWVAIRYFRRTRGRAALSGLAFLALVYLFARGLDLRLTAFLFQSFFAVVVIVLIVVFQEDLRRMFEQLGSAWRGGPSVPSEAASLDLLVRTIARLASARTGALIVLPGQDLLDRHIEGGVVLGGRLSEPLLLSLFDSHSPGHDGAVIIRGRTIDRFAVHLPLSANHQMLGPGGTRHAAALGLAERCDAICIAVSEERGTVSVARNGEMRVLSRPEDLVVELREAFEAAPASKRPWRGRIGLDGVLAIAAALVLWMVFVPGSDVSETTLRAPIEVTNLPSDMRLESIEPAEVEVTLRGLRRDLVLAQRGDPTIRLDAYLSRFGRRTFSVSAADVSKPDSVSVLEVVPEKIRISLEPLPLDEGGESDPEHDAAGAELDPAGDLEDGEDPDEVSSGFW